jgi:hypothetical protein
MNQYIISYLGGDQPASPEAGKKHFVEYQAWIGSLGDAAIQPMVPFKNIHTVSPDGSTTEGSSINMSGQTVIQAESIEAALVVAKGCPFLAINGTLEVAEVMVMG